MFFIQIYALSLFKIEKWNINCITFHYCVKILKTVNIKGRKAYVLLTVFTCYLGLLHGAYGKALHHGKCLPGIQALYNHNYSLHGS